MIKATNQQPAQTPSTKAQSTWCKNPMLLMVLGLPAFMVAVCIVFVIWSIKVQDSTVRDDWYMDGKALYQDASLDKVAYDLGLSGVMRFDNKTKQVLFELNSEQAIDLPKQLNVLISHATNKAFDQGLVLSYSHDNVYVGQVVLADISAKYYLTIKPDIGNWRLITQANLPMANVLFVPLDAFKDPNKTSSTQSANLS